MSRFHWGQKKSILLGNHSDNIINGSSRSDIIVAKRGDDSISAGAGHDKVFGGRGDDTIDGGSGWDRLFGGAGRDDIRGGSGNDLLFGGRGSDNLSGDEGCDVIFGGSGDDTLDGGANSDYLNAGRGNDTARYVMSENVGAWDVIDGGRGSDTLNLVLTRAEANDDGVQADLARFEDFLDRYSNPWSDHGYVFRFQAFDLVVQDFENLNIEIIDSGPVAVDDSAITDEDVAVSIDVLANDSGDDGIVLTVTSATASNGAVVIEADGSLTYTGDANFNGADTISYTIDDGNGGTASASVAVTVNAVNDAPVAVDDSAIADEDVAVSIDVLSNDRDLEGDSLTIASASAANGSVVIEADGSLTYTGDANFNGADTISYTIDDGNGGTASASVAVTVNAVNDAPQLGFLRAETGQSPVELSAVEAGFGGFAVNIDRAGLPGVSVSDAGDVNGDGLDDVIIGAPRFDPNGNDSGVSYVVFGKADGALVTQADLDAGIGGFAISGASNGDLSGEAVSSAGDVNGDGLDDLLVGAFQADPSGSSSGSSYVVFGKEDTASVELQDVENGIGGFAINGAASGDFSGRAVSGAGDVNGDGLADLIVGATGAGSDGRAYVVFGKTDSSAVSLRDFDFRLGDGFRINGFRDDTGDAVSAAGDVNGDGLADVIVGAPSGAGTSYVVFGKADNEDVRLSTVESGRGGFAISGVVDGDQTGTSVSGGGDINGDGLDDLIIGAQYADPNGPSSGSGYVVFGKTDGDGVELADVVAGDGGFAINGQGAGHYSGRSISDAGDINGDGLDDLIIGGNYANGYAGISHVVFGKRDGDVVELSDVAGGNGGFLVNPGPTDSVVGRSVSGGGDINGDGVPDLIVGAPGSNGNTYVIFNTRNLTFETDLTNMAPLEAIEDRVLPITNLAIADVDAAEGTGEVELLLSVNNGTLTVIDGGAQIAGNGSDTVTVTGSVADVNAAIAEVSYLGNLEFSGSESLSLQVSDLGNAGSGGVLTDTRSIDFDVALVVDGITFEGDPDGIGGSNVEDLLTMTGPNANDMFGFGGDDTMFGGLGDDTIQGNDGNDLIFGGEGDDLIGDLFVAPDFEGLEPSIGDANTFVGGTGNDTLVSFDGIDDRFVFNDGDGVDQVDGFEAGAGSPDVIDLTDFGLNGFADVQAAASEAGGNTTILLSGANGGVSITLNDIGLAELHPDDFSF